MDLRNYVKLKLYLDRSCDVLRNKFKYEWKLKYNEEWNDRSNQKLVTILGQKYMKTRKPIQRNNIINGNIDDWDISLLKELLNNQNLFSISPNDLTNIKELVNIRNNTAHYGSKNMSDNTFTTYRKQLYNNLKALGDNEDELKQLECIESIGGIEFCSEQVLNHENIAEAITLKQLGNQEYSRENYVKSIEYYTNAIILSGLPSTDRAIIYSYRCICYLKSNDLENAEKDAKETVNLWPQWWKGYYQKAQIYYAKNDYKSLTKAQKCLIQAQSHEQNDEITTLLNQVRQKIAPFDTNEVFDYRHHMTSTEDVCDYYYKSTGLDIYKNLMKISENIGANSNNPIMKNFEECIRGHRYLFGTDGFPLDYERAAQCYSKAANRGSALGLYNLSQLFRNGKGVKQDFELSVQYLLKAAQQKPYIFSGDSKIENIGVAEAEHYLGFYYETGLCVKKDLREAIMWYKKAVDHECADSANSLGLIYMNGMEFIAKDLVKAEQLLRFAISNGAQNAMGNISLLYMHKNEPELALEWCKKVREKGYEYPNLDFIESEAQKQLISLKNTLNVINKLSNINDEENSKLSLAEKLDQSISKLDPKLSKVLRKYKEITEKYNSKSPVSELSDCTDRFDIETLIEYAKTGKVYAKKLLSAKMYFINSLNALLCIEDHCNPNPDILRKFCKNFSFCAQIEFMVAYLDKSIEELICLALAKKTTYDEDVRICYAKINMKDINNNIIFLSECLKVYPKNQHFLEFRGSMYAFLGNYEKSIYDFNEALKLAPNDYEVLYLKAAVISKLEPKLISYQRVIDAYNQFISIAPEDHRHIPESYYAMALRSLVHEQNITKANLNDSQRYYSLGVKAEEKQLSFFMPYESPNKERVELGLQLKHNKYISISPQIVDTENKQLTNPYRIQIIKKHREFIDGFKRKFKNNREIIAKTWKPPNIQKSSQSIAGLKSICLRDIDPTTDKIYDKCVIELKSIDIVGTTGSSLVLVVEDYYKDVERCCIYNSPNLRDIESANQLYGSGSQFSVINPYLRIAADMKPAIRIDDISSIVMGEFIENMCRYCCESNATKCCSLCKTAKYCSRECQLNDYKLYSHKLICLQK